MDYSRFEVATAPYGEGPSGLCVANFETSRLVEHLREKIRDSEEKEKFEECLGTCESAFKLLSLMHHREFEILSAKFLVLTYQSQEAIDVLNKVFKEDPQNAEAISVLGLVFYYQGNLRKTVEVCLDALMINPSLKDTQVVLNTARSTINILKAVPCPNAPQEQFSVVIIRTLSDGLDEVHRNKEVAKILRFHRGFVYYKRKEFNLAIIDFTEALAIDDASVDTLMLRAKCYISIGSHDDAIIDLLEADKINKSKKVSTEIKMLRKQIGQVYITKTNYDILEVPRNATEIEIQTSYNSLSLLHRVNFSRARSDVERRKLEFKFKRTQNAFIILSNRTFKNVYDKHLTKIEAMIECPAIQACCGSLSSCFQCCSNGFSSCMEGSCQSTGDCIRGCCFGRGGLIDCFRGSSSDSLEFLKNYVGIFLTIVAIVIVFLMF